MVARGVQTVEDLGRQTPNLQLNMRQDTTTDVVIRGIGAYGDVLGVGFDIDGVPNFTDQTMRLEDLVPGNFRAKVIARIKSIASGCFRLPSDDLVFFDESV